MQESQSLAAAILAKLDALASDQQIRAAERLIVPSVPLDDEPAVNAPTIGQLLGQSKAAHLNYRKAASNQRWTVAADELATAARDRAAAEVADPNHADPAWQDDASLHPFQRFSHNGIHDDLLSFYLAELSKEPNGA